jgi:hypothetical protein
MRIHWHDVCRLSTGKPFYPGLKWGRGGNGKVDSAAAGYPMIPRLPRTPIVLMVTMRAANGANKIENRGAYAQTGKRRCSKAFAGIPAIQ